MSRRTRISGWIYAALAVVGTVAAILYAISVSSAAKTSLDVALLVFTCAAAVIGFLGLLVTYRSYRLEVGRVPKPDVAFLDGGKPIKRWEVEIQLLDPEDDKQDAEQLEQETDGMEALVASVEQSRAHRPSNSILGGLSMVQPISKDAVARYRSEVSEYLATYTTHLKAKRIFDALRARSREVVFAFTNDRAGVPAEGVRVIIHIPDDVRVFKPSDFMDDPGMPTRPTPPRAHSMFDTIAAMNRGMDVSYPALGAMRAIHGIGRPSNVSSPTIRSGASTEIEFEVGEILHNLHDDSHEDPLFLVFPRAATWTIRYEMHARNLPNPKRGELTVTTTAKTPAALAPLES